MSIFIYVQSSCKSFEKCKQSCKFYTLSLLPMPQKNSTKFALTFAKMKCQHCIILLFIHEPWNSLTFQLHSLKIFTAEFYFYYFSIFQLKLFFLSFFFFTMVSCEPSYATSCCLSVWIFCDTPYTQKACLLYVPACVCSTWPLKGTPYHRENMASFFLTRTCLK